MMMMMMMGMMEKFVGKDNALKMYERQGTKSDNDGNDDDDDDNDIEYIRNLKKPT